MGIATAVLWGPLHFVPLISGGENSKLIAKLFFFCKDIPLNLAKPAVARINMNHTEWHEVFVYTGVYRCACMWGVLDGHLLMSVNLHT